MTLTDNRTTGSLEQNEEWNKFAELLTDTFQDSVYGLLNDILLTHPYCGLVHFRDNVLSPVIGRMLSNMASKLIIQHMIDTGMLVVTKQDVVGRDYPVSVLSKGNINEPEVSIMQTTDSSNT